MVTQEFPVDFRCLFTFGSLSARLDATQHDYGTQRHAHRKRKKKRKERHAKTVLIREDKKLRYTQRRLNIIRKVIFDNNEVALNASLSEANKCKNTKNKVG